MEDPRLSRMYWKLVVESVEGSFLRSAWFWTLVLVAGLAWGGWKYGVGRGSQKAGAAALPAVVTGSDGVGQEREPLVLSRTETVGGLAPEFTSVTLLPGRGMEVGQITAFVPGRGEVKLLAEGGGSLGVGGAPFLISPAVNEQGAGVLLQGGASAVETKQVGEGQGASARFVSGDGVSGTETTVSVLLGAGSLEMTVDVRNSGRHATPVGIGWVPRFVLPNGDRERATLRVPSTVRLAMRDGEPVGREVSVRGTADDFTAAQGVALGDRGVKATFIHLQGAPDDLPTVELRDGAARFGLRFVAESATIRAIAVDAPAGAGFIGISPRTHYGDSSGTAGQGLLPPGQTLEWRVRLEVFPVMVIAGSPY